MCCIFTSLAVLGPRFAIFIWWLADPGRWDRAFDTWIWPLLGFVFLPWTTLMYVIVRPAGGVVGFDWIWLGLAVACDILTYTGGGYGNRDRMPGYSSQYAE
jgi:hypothetical protein